MIAKIVIALGVLGLGGLGFLWWLGGATAAEPASSQESAVIIRQTSEFLPQSSYEEQRAAVSRLVSQSQAEPAAAGEALPEAVPPALIEYEASELTPTAAGKAELQKYGLAFRRIMADYAAVPVGSDLRLFLHHLETSDATDLAVLSESRARHERAIGQLAALAVPTPALTKHVELINNFAALGEVIYTMSIVTREPTRAIESARVYFDRLSHLLASIAAMNVFFFEHQVDFGGEPPPQILISI